MRSKRIASATGWLNGDTVALSVTLFAAYAAMIAVYNGIGAVLLPSALQAIDPVHKVSNLATITTLSAVVTVIALLVGGAITDRTQSRWGRRTPAIVISCAVTVLLLPMLGLAHSTLRLLWLVPLVWFLLSICQVAVTAMLPDRIPIERRGIVAAAMALGAPIGIFVGVNTAALMPTVLLGYVALAVLLPSAMTCLVVFTPEPSSLELEPARPDASGAPKPSGMLSGFRDGNFRLAFASRFLLFVAYFSVTGYLYYLLQDYIGRAHLPEGGAGAAVSIVMSIITVAWVVVTPVTGFVADRVRDTPLLVGLSSIGIGVSMLAPLFSDTWSAILVLAIGMGLSFGIYFAIDLKLLSIVLPSAESAGRDIGMLSVATSAPQLLTPVIASAIISVVGYKALFAFGAAMAILGGATALFIQREPLTRATAGEGK